MNRPAPHSAPVIQVQLACEPRGPQVEHGLPESTDELAAFYAEREGFQPQQVLMVEQWQLKVVHRVGPFVDRSSGNACKALAVDCLYVAFTVPGLVGPQNIFCCSSTQSCQRFAAGALGIAGKAQP